MAAIFELPPTSAEAPAVGVPRTRPARTVRPPEGRRPRAVLLPALLAAAVLLAVLLVVTGHLPGHLATEAGSGSAGPVASGDAVVVGPGDTLWSIAAEHYPASLHSRAVAALTQLNGPSEGLEVGDVVSLAALG